MKNTNFETMVIDWHDRLKKDHLGLEPGRQSPPLWATGGLVDEPCLRSVANLIYMRFRYVIILYGVLL